MMTRSFGDAYLKTDHAAKAFNKRMSAKHQIRPLPGKRPYISHEAEVVSRQLQDGDSFLIVACDGIWDELTNHEAASRVGHFLRTTPGGDPAADLVAYALEKAARRLASQEPELNIRTRRDLLKIPPGKQGRKYLHDDMTVCVMRFDTPRSDSVETAAQPSHWKDIKRSVDIIRQMQTRDHTAQRWHSLVDHVHK